MTDTKELLIAYGFWARNNNESLGCKSPSLTLMSQAPHQCEQNIKRRRTDIPYISDETALMVDAAVMKLKCHSERLSALLTYYVDNDDSDMISIAMIYQVTMLRFYHNIKSQGIADKLNEYFDKPIFNRISVEKMIERGIGIVEGAMIENELIDRA